MSVSPVVVVRSLLFDLFFYLSTTVYCLAVLPAYPFLSAPGMRRVARVWQRMVSWGLRVIVGLSYEVRGREFLPQQPAIIASKHQSAWETLTFHILVPEVAVCLKDELTRIPVFGWYLMRAGSIRIDRGAAARAIRSLVLGAKRAIAEGLSVQIYPEGTRRGITDLPDYKPGVMALYSALRLPVVPVALNSGLFWPRHGFIRRPGRITVEFLPPIPAGLDRKLFMHELEATIETASARLVAEARQGS